MSGTEVEEDLKGRRDRGGKTSEAESASLGGDVRSGARKKRGLEGDAEVSARTWSHLSCFRILLF